MALLGRGFFTVDTVITVVDVDAMQKMGSIVQLTSKFWKAKDLLARSSPQQDHGVANLFHEVMNQEAIAVVVPVPTNEKNFIF